MKRTGSGSGSTKMKRLCYDVLSPSVTNHGILTSRSNIKKNWRKNWKSFDLTKSGENLSSVLDWIKMFSAYSGENPSKMCQAFFFSGHKVELIYALLEAKAHANTGALTKAVFTKENFRIGNHFRKFFGPRIHAERSGSQIKAG